jgi:ribonuclease G
VADESQPSVLAEQQPASSDAAGLDSSDSSGPLTDPEVEPAWSDPELEDPDDDEEQDEAAARSSIEPLVAASPSRPDLGAESLPVASPPAAPLATTDGEPRARRRHTTPLDDFFNLPGFTVSNPGDPTPKAPARPRVDGSERRDGWREGGGGGRRRGRGRGGDRGRSGRPGDAAAGGEGGRPADRQARSGREGRSTGSGLGRISKTTPIRDVVKEGQEIIVQVSKDPIGTKGARCTSHISLPGRYVVYVPTVDHIGVSKRIGSEKERARLRETIEAMKPPSGGLIVRTVAEGLTKKQLKADVGYLVRLWGEIAKKREGAKAPTLLSSELDLVLKTARDLFTDEVDQIVIDDKHQYDRLCHFVEMFMPERMKDIVYYSDSEPIFDAYGIEDEIGRALSRKVPLPSGGHLVIDQAEALTAIDVNTGRFVGKGSKDMEETILKTNLEAVHEIAYQLRFRNIGGLIILDLIDMERHGNREKVRRALEELLVKDKAKTTLNRISDLGLIEMTRKRTRESLGRLLHEPCFYCDGTGQLQSKETIAYEILREIRRRRQDLPGYTVVVHAHPAVADLLQGSEKDAVADAENKYMRKITVIPRTEYHLEQFDLSGK